MGRSSSSNQGGSSEGALRKMNKLVSSLFHKPDTVPFREPVDWRGLELWDYPKIVDRPMDLGTVKRKLESNSYDTAYDCAEDIRLVWDNCMLYNQEGSDFHILSSTLSRKFEERYRKIKSEYDTGEDSMVHSSGSAKPDQGSRDYKSDGDPEDRPPSLDEKTQFAGNIFKIGGDALGTVMQLIDVRCPVAIERNINGAEDELEINVDALDPRTFHELDAFVREKVVAIGRKHDITGKRKK